MKILVTGSAGFIGYHASKYFLSQGHDVLGYDSINDYYDPKYKHARLEDLKGHARFRFEKGFLEDAASLKKVWAYYQPSHVVHLAAQAGVRYSLENPMAYISSNIVGFQNVVDLVREYEPTNFVYASSSSVYGKNTEVPFSETQKVDNPISLYAATKASNELVAKTYGNLYRQPNTGLRFFTVYGPFSRPDMAMFKFADLLRRREKLPLYNHGEMMRDFTYIDDIVQGLNAALFKPEVNQVYNLGRGRPESLMEMVRLLEGYLGVKADLNSLPMQPGDVPATHADIAKARECLGYDPKTTLADGVLRFADWYKATHF